MNAASEFELICTAEFRDVEGTASQGASQVCCSARRRVTEMSSIVLLPFSLSSHMVRRGPHARQGRGVGQSCVNLRTG